MNGHGVMQMPFCCNMFAVGFMLASTQGNFARASVMVTEHSNFTTLSVLTMSMNAAKALFFPVLDLTKNTSENSATGISMVRGLSGSVTMLTVTFCA